MEIISVSPGHPLKVRSDKERQILYDFTCMGNLKKNTYSETQNRSVSARDGGWAEGKMGEGGEMCKLPVIR